MRGSGDFFRDFLFVFLSFRDIFFRDSFFVISCFVISCFVTCVCCDCSFHVFRVFFMMLSFRAFFGGLVVVVFFFHRVLTLAERHPHATRNNNKTSTASPQKRTEDKHTDRTQT